MLLKGMALLLSMLLSDEALNGDMVMILPHVNLVPIDGDEGTRSYLRCFRDVLNDGTDVM